MLYFEPTPGHKIKIENIFPMQTCLPLTKPSSKETAESVCHTKLNKNTVQVMSQRWSLWYVSESKTRTVNGGIFNMRRGCIFYIHILRLSPTIQQGINQTQVAKRKEHSVLLFHMCQPKPSPKRAAIYIFTHNLRTHKRYCTEENN